MSALGDLGWEAYPAEGVSTTVKSCRLVTHGQPLSIGKRAESRGAPAYLPLIPTKGRYFHSVTVCRPQLHSITSPCTAAVSHMSAVFTARLAIGSFALAVLLESRTSCLRARYIPSGLPSHPSQIRVRCGTGKTMRIPACLARTANHVSLECILRQPNDTSCFLLGRQKVAECPNEVPPAPAAGGRRALKREW